MNWHHSHIWWCSGGHSHGGLHVWGRELCCVSLHGQTTVRMLHNAYDTDFIKATIDFTEGFNTIFTYGQGRSTCIHATPPPPNPPKAVPTWAPSDVWMGSIHVEFLPLILCPTSLHFNCSWRWLVGVEQRRLLIGLCWIKGGYWAMI